LAVASTHVLTVNPSVPAKTMKELVDLVRANPGKYSFASGGTGTQAHLLGEQLRVSRGLDLVHVPFTGAGPAVASVVAGHTPIGFSTLASAAAQIQAGQIRALAVTSANASPRLPNVPTIASTLPGYDALEFHGLHAPVKTPQYVVAKLQREVSTILRRADVKERLDSLAMDASGNSSEEFSSFIRRQIQTWSKVGRAANVRAD